MKSFSFLASAVVLVSCISRNGWGSESDPLRLSRVVEPVTQALELELDPAAHGYSGLARIELRFNSPANTFRLHAEDLSVLRATVDGRVVQLAPGKAGLILATSETLISPGLHFLEIAFTNEFNKDGVGIYRTADGACIFTQMEPLHARQSFPCWDEPGFKIPWRVTVTVPAELQVVGNMPIAQTTISGPRKRVEFGRTPPMPSYLVLLAVGPFESRSIPKQPVPGQLFTIQGQTSLAELAANAIPPLLSALEDYFGLPYPYPKLDHIAAPEFLFGGMENAGAIMYKDAFVLFEGSRASYEQRRLLLEILAHEMAHMWFGNLVTMTWWDDLWLNESFATWLSFKVAHQLHPDMRFDALGYSAIANARAADSQPSVKAIRRAFAGGDNVLEAMDALSYNKEQAILRMIEGWVGEEKFQSVLRRYCTKHSWGNARAEDFWSVFVDLGEAEVQGTVERYVEQPGIPELSFKLLPNDMLEIRQRRYRTLIGTGVADQTWQVPVVARYASESGLKTNRFLLTKESDVFKAPGVNSAAWVYPNAGESGYFTWNLPPDLTKALTARARSVLSTVERLGVLSAAKLSVQSGTFGADEYLRLLVDSANDPDPEIQQEVVKSLTSVYHDYLGVQNRPDFNAMVRRTLRPLLDRIGFDLRPQEQAQRAALRASLLFALGIHGDDKDVLAFCRELALRQLVSPRSVDASIAEPTMAVCTWHGDADWSQRLRRAFNEAKEPEVRERFLNCLILFNDPFLARSGLDYLLTDNVRPTEIFTSLSASRHPELAAVIFEWIANRYDALKEKFPHDYLGFLPFVLTAGDETLLAKGRAFFLEPSRTTALGEVELKKAAESVNLRTALRERYRVRVAQAVAELASRTNLQQNANPAD